MTEGFDPDEIARGYGEEPPAPIRPLHSTHLVEVAGDELAQSTTDIDELPYLPFCGVDGYIIEGWSHLFAAYPRTGKTELVVRQVRDWIALGRTVLYLTEEARPMWEFRLRHLPGEWSRLRVVFGLGSHPASLLARAFSGSEEIVVLDAVRNLLQLHDENDNSELARVTNPWVARARESGKTLVAVHHMRKGSGEHGEGISGGHAILGSFDIALEVLRDPNSQRRRKVRAYCRLITPDELAYEMTEAGEIVSLGDPREASLSEVVQRVLDVLGPDFEKTETIVAALEDPPSREQVRRALVRLAGQGQAERDPPMADKASGKTHRWRRRESKSEPPPIGTPVGGGGLGVRSAAPSRTSPATDGPLGGGEVGADRMLRAATDLGLASS